MEKDTEKTRKKPPVMEAIYAAPARPVSDDPPARPRPDFKQSEMLCVYAGPEWFAGRRPKNDAPEQEAPETPDPDYPDNYDEPETEPGKSSGEDGLDEEERKKLMEDMLNGPQMMGLVMAPNTFPSSPAAMVCDSSLPDSTPKFCPMCGSVTVENANYCTYCGAKLRRTE